MAQSWLALGCFYGCGQREATVERMFGGSKASGPPAGFTATCNLCRCWRCFCRARLSSCSRCRPLFRDFAQDCLGWACGGVGVHRWLRSAVIVSAVIQSFHSGGNNNTVINLRQQILSPAAETNSQHDTITASWGRGGGDPVQSLDWIMMFNTSCLNSLQCSERRLSLLDG